MATAEDLAAVRFEIGGTAPDLITDEQIEYALEEEGGVRGAAALCLEALSRRYAQQADVETGDMRLGYRESSENLAKRAAELRKRIASNSGAPFAGGISESDKEARAEDADRVQGAFSRRQFDRPDV